MNNLNRENIFFDIGANFGQIAITIAKNVGCKCYCFEPIPVTYILLKRNIELNQIANIIAEPIAVSNESGVINMCRENYTLAGSRVFAKEQNKVNAHSHYYTVKRVTIDSYVKEMNIGKIDMIKIDCEGHDLQVLKGAVDTIKKYSPDILCEIHFTGGQGYTAYEAFTFLKKRLEYRCCFGFNDDKREIEKIDSIQPNISNYLFTNRNIIL